MAIKHSPGCKCCGSVGECFCGMTVDGGVHIKHTVSGLLPSYDMSGQPDSYGGTYTITGLDFFNGTYYAAARVHEFNCNGLQSFQTWSETKTINNSIFGNELVGLSFDSYAAGIGIPAAIIATFATKTNVPGAAINNIVMYDEFHCNYSGGVVIPLSPLPTVAVTTNPYVLYRRQSSPSGRLAFSTYQFEVKREFVVI